MVAKYSDWRLMGFSDGHHTLHPSSKWSSLHDKRPPGVPRNIVYKPLRCPLSPSTEHTLGQTIWDQKKIKPLFPHDSLLLKMQTSFECYVLRFINSPLLMKTCSVFLRTFTVLYLLEKVCTSDKLWCSPFCPRQPPELEIKGLGFVFLFLYPEGSWSMGCLLSKCCKAANHLSFFLGVTSLNWWLCRINNTREKRKFSEIQISATL